MTTDRDLVRRDAYDQRMALLSLPKWRAAAAKARVAEEREHRMRLDDYAHGRRGPMAHHHTHGGRIRRAAKAAQRARRAARIIRHQDPRTWRQRKAAA